MSDRRNVKSAKQIPLEESQRTEINPKTGKKRHVTSLRRGILKRETTSFDCVLEGFTEMARKTSRQELEEYADVLRAGLRKAGLPTDQEPGWIKRPGGEWERDKPNPDTDRIAIGTSYQRWTKRVSSLTEPLSDEGLAAELLSNLTQLLSRKGIDDHLWHICRLMNSYSFFRIAVATNSLATAGMRANECRARGPHVRRNRAKAIRRVIWDLAQQHWAKFPLFKNDAANTAEVIAAEVNLALQSEGHAGLKPKTVADHIRSCIRDNSSSLAKPEANMAITVKGKLAR